MSTKVKPNAPDSSSKGKAVLSVTKKKTEGSTKPTVDSKQKSVSTVTKSEVKSKSASSSSRTTTKTTTTVKVREKKVYTLPGQKHDPPEEREPLRIFYESLSKQIPSSEMAEFWMMEHGLLSPRKPKRHMKRNRGDKSNFEWELLLNLQNHPVDLRVHKSHSRHQRMATLKPRKESQMTAMVMMISF